MTMLRRLCALAPLLAFAGCSGDRPPSSSGSLVPDRGDHALVVDEPAQPAQSATGPRSGASAPVSAAPNPGPGETVVLFQDGDRLYRIADSYGVTLRWLIRRNDLQSPPRSGTRLIVPQRGKAP